jgi:hypothetical protein
MMTTAVSPGLISGNSLKVSVGTFIIAGPLKYLTSSPAGMVLVPVFLIVQRMSNSLPGLKTVLSRG